MGTESMKALGGCPHLLLIWVVGTVCSVWKNPASKHFFALLRMCYTLHFRVNKTNPDSLLENEMNQKKPSVCDRSVLFSPPRRPIWGCAHSIHTRSFLWVSYCGVASSCLGGAAPPEWGRASPQGPGLTKADSWVNKVNSQEPMCLPTRNLTTHRPYSSAV